MTALLDNVSVPHDQNTIRGSDRAEPMRDDKTRSSLSSVRVSIELVASSRISIGGRHSITRAMHRSCFCPCDSDPPSSEI